MPGIATHYIFATKLYGELEHIVGAGLDEFHAFALGSQGPDPLFYAIGLPVESRFKRIGSTMHRQHTVELLACMHDSIIARHDTPPHCKAYALGFLCHYLLDSTVHPLVFAQEEALCKDGFAGITGVWAGRIAHATMETQFDEYMMTKDLGTTALNMQPSKVMLACPDEVLDDISRAIADAIARVFELDVPQSLYSDSVKLYRFCQGVFDSKSSGIRARFDFLKIPFMPAAYANALSHSANPRTDSVFLNHDHVPWPHPSKEGATVSESFDELYDQALDAARCTLPYFAQPSLNEGFIANLINDTNFLGK